MELTIYRFIDDRRLIYLPYGEIDGIEMNIISATHEELLGFITQKGWIEYDEANILRISFGLAPLPSIIPRYVRLAHERSSIWCS